MRIILNEFFKNFYYFMINKNFRTFIRLSLLNTPSKRFKERKLRFNNVTFSIPDAMSFLWQYKEVFFYEVFKFKATSEKPIIIDCGANVGTVSTYFKLLYPESTIHCFEPDPKVFTYLKGNMERNSFKNVTLHNKAVWTKEETLTFDSEGADSGSLVVNDESKNKIQVLAINLSNFMDQFDKIDFLKMDIEGAENEVIPAISDKLHKVNNIFIEYHSFVDKKQDFDGMLKILTDNGFTYHIDNMLKINQPFVDERPRIMNNQLNIFAYKK